MNLSYEAKIALTATVVSVAAGGLMAKYGGDVSGIIFGNQATSSESSGLANCPPDSVNVESVEETAHGSDLGLAPSGVICTFSK